jgi:hypothetical protein
MNEKVQISKMEKVIEWGYRPTEMKLLEDVPRAEEVTDDTAPLGKILAADYAPDSISVWALLVAEKLKVPVRHAFVEKIMLPGVARALDGSVPRDSVISDPYLNTPRGLQMIINRLFGDRDLETCLAHAVNPAMPVLSRYFSYFGWRVQRVDGLRSSHKNEIHLTTQVVDGLFWANACKYLSETKSESKSLRGCPALWIISPTSKDEEHLQACDVFAVLTELFNKQYFSGQGPYPSSSKPMSLYAAWDFILPTHEE